MAAFFTPAILQSALEQGLIYALIALALFLSYSMLNVCDLSTDGCYTLGCATGAVVAIAGYPILAIFAAMGVGVCSGMVNAFLQTKMKVESMLAGIIVNTGAIYHQYHDHGKIRAQHERYGDAVHAPAGSAGGDAPLKAPVS